HYRELLEAGINSDELLGAIESLAESSSDLGVLEEVIERRVSLATEPQEQCAWLERLGDLAVGRQNDPAKAAAAFKRAAAIAEAAPLEDERARALYERALSAAPTDVDAAERLFRSYVRAELWDDLARVAKVLVDHASTDAEAVRHLLDFEA